MKALAALIALSACVPAGGPGPMELPAFGPTAEAKAPQRTSTEYAYSIASVGNHRLEAIVKDQAQRLSQATGLTIGIAEWGVPIWLEDGDIDLSDKSGAPHPDGIPECGTTSFSQGWAEVQWAYVDSTPPVSCNAIEFTLLHELIHALGVVGHSHYGLMHAYATPGREPSIDSDALELLCSQLPCSKFAPERWNQR